MPSKTKRRDAGAGALFQDSRGLWTARVELPTGPDGKRRQKVIRSKSKDAASTKLKALMAELGRAGDLPTSSPTVASWMNDWLSKPTRSTKVRTTDGYRGYVDRYIVPAIGKIRLDRLTTGHVDHLHRSMMAPPPTGKGLSSTTALQAHRILAKALTDAMRAGKVSRNVATLVDAPSKALSTREALTAEQARALLLSVASDDVQAAAWSVALMTGLRQGERLGITREFVDLDAGILTVAWQLQRLTWRHGCGTKGADGYPCGRVRGGWCPERFVKIPDGHEAREVDGLWLTRPKSKSGWRQVPMTPLLARVLTRYLDDHAPGMEGLVFTRDKGRPIDPRDDNVAWDAALRTAGLPDVVGHSARHTANTLLHALGVDPETRQKIMGHSSAVVNATYVHVSDPLMRDAMDRLGAVFAPQIES
jgi:integrase